MTALQASTTRIRIPEAPACTVCRDLMKVTRKDNGYEASCSGRGRNEHGIIKFPVGDMS